MNKSPYLAIFGMVAAIALCMLWVDRPVAEYFKLLDQTTPQLIKPFKIITDAGKSQWFLWPLAAGCVASWIMIRTKPDQSAIWRARMTKAGFIFVSLAASGLLTDGIKILVGRPRPVLLPEQIFNQFTPFIFDAKWWSFPSGHSTSVMALALAVTVIAPYWRWPFLIFAGIITSSRIIVAAHYPADVIGGICVAILVHNISLRVFTQRRWALWNGPAPSGE